MCSKEWQVMRHIVSWTDSLDTTKCPLIPKTNIKQPLAQHGVYSHIKDAIWFNECPSNISKTDEYGLQGVLAYLARNISRRPMHLFTMARTFEIFTIGF